MPLTSCPPLSQYFSIHLSDKTHGTISDTTLKRCGLLQGSAQDGRRLLFQATPQTKARDRALASVTLRSCGAKERVVTTLDLVCTDMEHTTSELSLISTSELSLGCPVPKLGFPNTTSNTRTGFLERWSVPQACQCLEDIWREFVFIFDQH